MGRLLAVLRYVVTHPLNRKHKLRAAGRFLAWQVGARILGKKVVTPWVEDARFIVGLGETGLTGNLYAGFLEFEDMVFMMHILRRNDVLLDVGANAGAYSILASKVVGARSVAFEPVPSTFERLRDQIQINSIESRVLARNVGVGDKSGVLRFTTDHDTVNKVSIDDSKGGTVAVQVISLDAECPAEDRYFLKLDVEGYEHQVLEGASILLASGQVFAVIVELNGSGKAFGHTDEEVHSKLVGLGFRPVAYDPIARVVSEMGHFRQGGGNTIYVRDVVRAAALCKDAPYRVVHTAGGARI